MAHIFVSYKSETEKQALEIVRQLEDAGIDCWIACRDIPVGSDYIDEIPMAIDSSPFFILLLSSQMHISPWVKLELKQAISSGKQVLPLMLEDFKLHPNYAFMLQNYQVYPLFRSYENTFQDVISRIYKAIPSLGGKAPAPKPVPAPKKPVVSYTGNEPYIFVSYAHKDMETVMPIVRSLQERGFRIWLDTGIEIGSEWSEHIVDRILQCSCFLPFISKNYQNSHACRGELHFSEHEKKPIVPVYLEECPLSLGFQMQLSGYLTLLSYSFPDPDSFVAHLSGITALAPCKTK